MDALVKDIVIGGVTFAGCEWLSEEAKKTNKYLALAPGVGAFLVGKFGIKGNTGKIVAIAGGISVIENLIEVVLK
jgi:hypothetical protein